MEEVALLRNKGQMTIAMRTVISQPPMTPRCAGRCKTQRLHPLQQMLSSGRFTWTCCEISQTTKPAVASSIIQFLAKSELIAEKVAKAAWELIELRNTYAHARGKEPESDALKAIEHIHTIVEGTVSVFHDHEIVNGRLVRTSRPSDAGENAK